MQLLLSTVCLALTSAVIGNAYYQKNQFYPAVVYITKSNASMAVIYIQFFVIVFMFGKLLRKIFLGTLRAAEFEHLLERFWYAITETCLAFTVFRDDFNPRFVALFTVLLFLKSFHWLAEERVDFMERSPVLGWLFHIRVASLLTLLGTFDYILLMHAYNSTLERGPTVQLVFGFEYAILLTVVASTAIKYVLHTAEMRTDTPWENKAVFLLYTELVIGLIKVVLYVLFVVIMVKIYALPMFVFRPMFFTIRSFKKALSDVIMSRRAIRNMNTLYPDATPEELRLSDNICIICREDMLSHSKKLPCGHIFHTTCLRSWFQRQQTCPTCRLNILRAPAVNSTALPRAEDQQAAPGVGGAAAVGGGIAGMPPNILPGVGLATPLAVPQAPNAAAAGPGATTVLVNGVEQLRLDGVNGATTTTTTTNVTNIFETLGGAYFSNYAAGMPMLPPPLMMPPPFPFIAPYAVPPPPMPEDLTNLSEDELRAMEGTERKHIEERLKHLRNIQQMLDAASVLMNNYQIISSRLPAPAAATVNATANAADKPSTSTAAAAAITAATVNCFAAAAAAAVAATTLDNINAQQPNNQATTLVDVTSCTTSTIESTTTTTTTTTSTTETVGSGSSPLNTVTIEDIPGDIDDENVTSTSSTSTSPITTIIKTTTTTTSSDNADTTELNELRRRRIKFLEELNKTKMTTTTTTTD